MYEDKRVRRGEIYSVVQDGVLPGEQGASRPALIISNNLGNDTSPVVNIVYLTTRDHDIGIHYGPTKATGRPSYVQCEQIYTVNKQRLGRLMGSLSTNEMKEVEDKLDEVLDLGYIDDAPLKEKEKEIGVLKLQLEELKAKNAELNKKIEAHADELITRDVELAVQKRMYEKAVGIIAAMKAEPDMPENPRFPKKKPVEESPKPEEPKNPEPSKPVEPKLVDINTATFSQLRAIGLSNNVVLTVINKRPHKRVEDLKNIPGINAQKYKIIEKKICCVPMMVEEPPKVEEPEEEPKPVVEETVKVNVNRCTASDLIAIGITPWHSNRIVKRRDAYGDFEKLEDITNIDKITVAWLDQYRDKLEV